MPATTAAPAVPVPKDATKHRACDECRTRKLACSKDPDGCERCKREGITCHYSEQKPMGRPRKRQFIETTKDDSIPDSTVESLDMGPLPFAAEDLNSYNDGAIAEPYYTNAQSALGFSPETTQQGRASALDNGQIIWHFGDREVLGSAPIDFGDLNFDSVDDVNSGSDVPVLSTASNTSASDSGNSPPQSGALAPCSCLASMYLALSSLQQFPTDIVLALKTVRGAARTAAESIWCPQCGAVVLEKPQPPIDAFQNTMLLGTLLPIIAHGYQRLLKMIDEETDKAVAAGQTKTFRFNDYGGLCRNQTTIAGEMACLEKELMFNAVEMPPSQWRTTVRALLRVDIYGHEQASFKHHGLKGLVSQMEERQRARHEWLDELHRDGGHVNLGFEGHFGNVQCLGERTHGCLQILQMAKLAIDSLVIA
ncbi:hypothetical protein G7Y89_g652 [Cudoniella acicularis]|uniref:Zn(2)-C6 fungal-type domain-containing protein n=1 Tax=Cudoniella acicularis TaxID=354080 RepID=A0A8H4RYF8_9HELO|nr:hypothetical protein G7Y89_g652 [Cudoniella acicularis]